MKDDDIGVDSINKVLMSLISSMLDKHKEQLGEDNCNNIKKLATENRELLMLDIKILNNTLSDLIEEASKFPENDRSRKFKHLLCSQDISDFFDKYFSKFEGSAFSHDKTHFTLSSMEKSLKEDNNLSLVKYYTGEESWNTDKSKGRCYWSPLTITDTDTAFELYTSYLRVDIKKFAELCMTYNAKR